jgi:hypothetical protein
MPAAGGFGLALIQRKLWGGWSNFGQIVLASISGTS